MKNSLRTIAALMNPRPPSNSLKQLWKEHRYAKSSFPFSFQDVVGRHTSSSTKYVKLLFYNTYLLTKPVVNDAPARKYRAAIIGKELRKNKYDLAFLVEVFEKSDAALIKKFFGPSNEAFGPGEAGAENGSGLYTLSRPRIIRDKPQVFKNEGDWFVTDAYAQKGILFSEIDVGPGNIDFYSTHLIYGETFGEALLETEGMSEEERTALRLKQVDELCVFISKTHKKDNIIVFTGDFNIDDQDRNNYNQMMRKLTNVRLSDGSIVRLEDSWRVKGGPNGATNNPYTKCKLRYEMEGVFCDDDTESQGGRIDYIFIQEPEEHHKFNLDFTQVRRKPFSAPELDLDEVLDVLELAATPNFMLEIKKRVNLDFEDILNPNFEDIFNFRTRREFFEKINREIDLKQLFNNWLKRECKHDENDKYGHLSDHLGLETTLVASPK